jgi:hypothetical protein
LCSQALAPVVPASESCHAELRLDCHWHFSPQGLRILDHGCDIEIDDPDTPLSLWDSLEKEVTGGWLRAILVSGVFCMML